MFGIARGRFRSGKPNVFPAVLLPEISNTFRFSAPFSGKRQHSFRRAATLTSAASKLQKLKFPTQWGDPVSIAVHGNASAVLPSKAVMLLKDWITTDLSSLFGVAISSIFVYAGIIAYCRLTGLRSFSKMSSSDFAMTVAVGSLFASTISSPDPTLVLGLFALGMLFGGQWLIALIRRRYDGSTALLDNKPLLLMRGATMIEEHMDRANVTCSDILGKLREANVQNFDQVRAVVFEATGDISVLHAPKESDSDLDGALLEDVIGWDKE